MTDAPSDRRDGSRRMSASPIVDAAGCSCSRPCSPRRRMWHRARFGAARRRPDERNLTVERGVRRRRGGRHRAHLPGRARARRATRASCGRRRVTSTSGATPLIKSLLAGPNDEELATRLRHQHPPGDAAAVDALRSGDVLTSTSRPRSPSCRGELLVLAVAQIVFTATEIDGVRAVRLTRRRPGSALADGQRRDLRRAR